MPYFTYIINCAVKPLTSVMGISGARRQARHRGRVSPVQLCSTVCDSRVFVVDGGAGRLSHVLWIFGSQIFFQFLRLLVFCFFESRHSLYPLHKFTIFSCNTAEAETTGGQWIPISSSPYPYKLLMYAGSAKLAAPSGLNSSGDGFSTTCNGACESMHQFCDSPLHQLGPLPFCPPV